MFELTVAHIVALAVSCIFFGLAFATFILCIQSLCSIPFRSFTRVRTALLFVSCTTFIIGALSVAQALRRVLRAFVYVKGGTTPVEELNDPHDISNWIHSISYPIQAFLGDSVLVYWTWVVNNHDWRFIIFPVILVIGNTFAGFGIAYAMSRTQTLGYLHPRVIPWTTAFIAISLTLNMICTALITIRILRVTRRTAPSNMAVSAFSSSLSVVQRVVIESGLIYTLTSIVLLVTGALRSAAAFIVADAITPICFNLIIIRTSKLHRKGTQPQSPRRLSFPLRLASRESRRMTRTSSNEGSKQDVESAENAVQMYFINRPVRGGVVVTEEKWTAIV